VGPTEKKVVKREGNEHGLTEDDVNIVQWLWSNVLARVSGLSTIWTILVPTSHKIF
jgi:hypothetical protein